MTFVKTPKSQFRLKNSFFWRTLAHHEQVLLRLLSGLVELWMWRNPPASKECDVLENARRRRNRRPCRSPTRSMLVCGSMCLRCAAEISPGILLKLSSIAVRGLFSKMKEPLHARTHQAPASAELPGEGIDVLDLCWTKLYLQRTCRREHHSRHVVHINICCRPFSGFKPMSDVHVVCSHRTS